MCHLHIHVQRIHPPFPAVLRTLAKHISYEERLRREADKVARIEGFSCNG
ncbi:hypothetical protein GLA29479_4639 [Lysobacter antibioticus]|uniref:Uncharacterized protein n=1 Tax=Lysobacter antibioticus TaxID=84531 RepID=A0A0S2FDK3_LYSAN|nr:hypothetical protein GLA29479_4639 [Lysobacter antibioticus]ALN81572.1 hypothetical protein LA76x_3448 [Lysobacter antibioticus]